MIDLMSKDSVLRFKAPGPWVTRELRDCVLVADYDALREAAVRAERKLSAYVGVCSGDKELTNAVLPMLREQLRRSCANPQVSGADSTCQPAPRTSEAQTPDAR